MAEILTTRAGSISRDPAEEAVVIVAHGPSSDADNNRWLQNMSALARAMVGAGRFASVDYLTVRDDSPKVIRNAVTAQLRAMVGVRAGEGRRVLIVPPLLSFGGIERGIATRLEGLPYTMAGAALMPDVRLVTWVLEMAEHTPYARMDPAYLGNTPDEELLRSRLRKMVIKNIGIMYYGLPVSRDPRSVLYGNVLGLDDLDYMSEFFEPRQ